MNLQPAAPSTASRVGEPAPAPGVSLAAAYAMHSDLVAGIGYRVLRHRDEVSDLVQDVFVAALRAGPRLDSVQSLPGWLAIVTARAASKRLRTRRLRRALGFDTDLPLDRVASPGCDAETSLMVRRLRDALEKLPAELRLAWSLRHLEDQSLECVAQECGCSISTAKRRINAASARLRSAANGKTPQRVRAARGSPLEPL